MEKRGIQLPEELSHYTKKDDDNAFIYHWREKTDQEKILLVMADAVSLIKLCDGCFDDTSEYQLLIRMLKEQIIIDDNGSRRLRKREEKENASKVLLNPSDPEATFRKKAGEQHRGYVGNIVESTNENGSIVTEYAYEPNIHSDSQFGLEYIESQPIYKEPVTLVADGAYGSEHATAKAKEHNIRFISTNFTGIKPDDIYCDFLFSKDGKTLLQCANGHIPFACQYDSGNDRTVAYFSTECCEQCAYKDRCKPRFLKAKVRKEVSWKAVKRAEQLRYMQTEEFKSYSHFRNGVESIPSLLRRKYRVDKIPTHGKLLTKLHFGFKIAALNFQKLLAFSNGIDIDCPKRKLA